MKIKQLLVLLFAVGLFGLTAQAQVKLRVDLVEVVGTDLYFDIYLNTSSGQYGLNTSDFTVVFDPTAFTNPTFAKAPDPMPVNFNKGYNTFTSINHTDATAPATQLFVQKRYYDNTITAIVGNYLIVNLGLIIVSTVPEYNDAMGQIDSTPDAHRLGRFVVSGYQGNDCGEDAGLVWYENDDRTVLFHMIPDAPQFTTLPFPVNSFAVTSSCGSACAMATTAVNTKSCYGLANGTASVSVSNGQAPFTYAWSNGETTSSVQGLTGGTYSVVVTDANGCTATSTTNLDKSTSTLPGFSLSLNSACQLSLFPTEPNPFETSTLLPFHLPLAGQVEVGIYDALGSLVYVHEEDFPSGMNQLRLNRNDLSPGFYFVKVKVGEAIATQKIVISK